MKHNVTAGNQVDFINGQGTTSVVTQEADGKNKVSFDVNVDGKTTDYTEAPVYQKDANGNIVKAPDGKPVQEKNADGTPKTIKQVSVLTGDITPVRDLSDPNAGKVKFDATNGSIATVEQVADAINGSGWKTTDKDGKTVLVNPGATVNYVNGKNTKANVTKNASGGVDVTYDVDVTVPTTSTSVEASGKAQLDNPAEGNAFVNATTMRDTINNVSHTITSVNKPTEQVVANNGVTTKVKAGNTVTYAAGKNLVVRQDGSTMTYGLARDIDINSVQFNGGPTITNTADGDLKVAKADGSAARITNVAAGKAPTDAVNVSQLDDKIGNLNNKINKNNKGNRAGIASVAAMANIPQVYLPGKSGLGVGVGTREGQAALAVGYSRSSDNGKHIIKLSVGVDSQSKSTAAAGYMYQW
ncbi:YadA family autotransporter adhesin [Rodentibacter haemolyticus]|uniref:YadA-like family protein n=1 Tax=Rodentibacter haemolyticus TaxID=2778911 RepID=A0ABX6V2G6_9PAST|nr:YadA-like family protein [Rodentibacter haemolyticus]QPB43516.1 YadA-like family protein [Rodentibacter haemolyticus]